MKRSKTILGFISLILVLAACGGGKTEETSPTPTPIATGTSNRNWTPVSQIFDGVEMVLVPAGCFVMGSTDAQVEAVFQQCESELGTENCDRSLFERPFEKVKWPVLTGLNVAS